VSAARWYDLGQYRVLAMPLPTNPAFTTHRIYLGAKYIGAQLSVPTAADCAWLLATAGLYAQPSAPSFAWTRTGQPHPGLYRRRSRNNRPERDARAALSVPDDEPEEL